MKLRKLTLAFLAAAFVTAGFTSNQAQGAMINGAINFAGGAVYDTNSLATATTVKGFRNVVVTATDGDFDSVAVGSAVTMAKPYVFMPSTPTANLWSVGGFTFDLTMSTVDFRSNNALIISGVGTISGNGFIDTPGTWEFTSQTPSAKGVFSFSAGSEGSGSAVPDGGTTVALLGISLVGLELMRRKFVTS